MKVIKKEFWLPVVLLFINVYSVFGQGSPCGDSGDPDLPATCPLDNWVWVLVVGAVAFSAYKLHSAQKEQKINTNNIN